MAEELDFFESSLSDALNQAVYERTDCFEQFKENQHLQMEIKNMEIRHDIDLQNLNTKIKLVRDTNFYNLCMQLQEALTKRNQDFDFAEDNNRQLLSLLEKYDNKLDELQEDIELRDLKIIEYE